MKFSLIKNWIFSFSFLLSIIEATNIVGDIRVCAIVVEFQEDDKESTTGNGQLLNNVEGIDCGEYHIDSPPHNNAYFRSQLQAVDSYFSSVSYNQFGINIDESDVYPLSDASYKLDKPMSYYNPYNVTENLDTLLTNLFVSSLELAYSTDAIDYSLYDLIIIFHAGIGQDFSLPFLDPTPEDIPSTFIDEQMIYEYSGNNIISIGGHTINKGIIMPETQNHLNYDISIDMFSSEQQPCDYQYGLTGTLSLMIGFAIGLPPLWDIETGDTRIGVFGLMDQGSNNGRGLIPSAPDPWSRIYAGWETPTIVNQNSQIALPKISNSNIVRVDINESEYFLIENRINHFKKKVSIDSIRYKIWKETEEYPDFIRVLMDSVQIEKDQNGVIVSIPDYDIGLPGSGLLIWHIDEHRINAGIDDYSINKYIENNGVDLEEADGAQDIGYQSFFMFNDPSSGYFGDMWFKDNLEYYRANPNNEGAKPVFNDLTYPSTKSNEGLITHLSIDNISQAQDTMTFNVINTYKPYGFSDTTAFLRMVSDFNDLDSVLYFGGKDSIWCSNNFNNSRSFFHTVSSNDLMIGYRNSDEFFLIDIFEYFNDYVEHYVYEYQIQNNDIVYRNMITIDSLLYPLYDNSFQELSFLDVQDWLTHNKTVYGPDDIYIINNLNQISLKNNNSLFTSDNKYFDYISGIDLNLDASIDVLALDTSGYLNSYNNQLMLLSGFPLNIKLKEPILSKNIIGDTHPEIIAMSADNNALLIISYDGEIISQIATHNNDELVSISVINQKNCIITRSSVFEYSDAIITYGNQWTSFHGDLTNNRKIQLDYQYTDMSNPLLGKAYCYPNPIKGNKGKIRVETNNAQTLNINLYDASGYFIEKYSKNVNSNGYFISEWDIDINSLESGVYFANVDVVSNSLSLVKQQSKIIKIAVIK